MASSRQIPSLDGLRAISVVLVMVGHGVSARSHSFAFRLLLLHQNLGVRIFFVISGFLITTLLLDERSVFKGVSLRLFYIRRALRILPPFFVYMATIVVLNQLSVINVPGRDLIYGFTYTMNYDPSPAWQVGHLWSLSVEEQFYLVWPLIVRWCGRPAWIAAAFVGMFSEVAIHGLHFVTGINLIISDYGFLLVCGPIATGCLLALMAPRLSPLVVSARWLRGIGLAGCVLLIVVLDTFRLAQFGSVTALIINLLLGAVIARLAFAPTGATARVLNSEAMCATGRASYSLYLWQELFINPFSTAAMCRFPLNVIATVLVSAGSYYLVEHPFLRWRRRFRRASEVPAIGMIPRKTAAV
jgi:peptidoglycan/LPS O-acetylase OafA/YrhL